MTVDIERISAEHHAWLANRVAGLRAEYEADDVLNRRRARTPVVRRAPREPRARWAVLLADALGAAFLALFLVAALTFVMTI